MDRGAKNGSFNLGSPHLLRMCCVKYLFFVTLIETDDILCVLLGEVSIIEMCYLMRRISFGI